MYASNLSLYNRAVQTVRLPTKWTVQSLSLHCCWPILVLEREIAVVGGTPTQGSCYSSCYSSRWRLIRRLSRRSGSHGGIQIGCRRQFFVGVPQGRVADFQSAGTNVVAMNGLTAFRIRTLQGAYGLILQLALNVSMEALVAKQVVSFSELVSTESFHSSLETNGTIKDCCHGSWFLVVWKNIDIIVPAAVSLATLPFLLLCCGSRGAVVGGVLSRQVHGFRTRQVDRLRPGRLDPSLRVHL
jgi:hypothetical protein